MDLPSFAIGRSRCKPGNLLGERPLPVPKPRKGEQQSDFVSRCARQMFADGTDDPKQAAAICFQAWRDRDKDAADDLIVRAWAPLELKRDSGDSGRTITGTASTPSTDRLG